MIFSLPLLLWKILEKLNEASLVVAVIRYEEPDVS
jgi:hypothetical protein